MVMRRFWTLALLAVGVSVIAATLGSHDWVVDVRKFDYRWGLHSSEFCGSSPCYISGEDVFSAAGPFAFYLAIASVVASGYVLINLILRTVGRSKEPMRVMPIVAAVLTGTSTVFAIYYVANRPIEGLVGWPYPAFLHGAILAIVGLYLATGQDPSPSQSVRTNA